jgi:hypothetical protein
MHALAIVKKPLLVGAHKGDEMLGCANAPTKSKPEFIFHSPLFTFNTH